MKPPETSDTAAMSEMLFDDAEIAWLRAVLKAQPPGPERDGILMRMPGAILEAESGRRPAPDR